MASFIHYNIIMFFSFEIITYCCMYRCLSPLMGEWYFIVYTTVCRQMDYFQVLAIMNQAAVNIVVQSFVDIPFHFHE